MRRYELLKSIIPILKEHLVISNIGIPSQELHSISDNNNFFYMLGSMGLASSIGLGLSLAINKKVISIDGDGSVLMNLGTLSTVGNNAPENFILLIIDNGAYSSTGEQPTYTSKKTNLAAIARAAGCEHVYECEGNKTFEILTNVLKSNKPSVIVSHVKPGSEEVDPINLHPIVIRERFRSEL